MVDADPSLPSPLTPESNPAFELEVEAKFIVHRDQDLLESQLQDFATRHGYQWFDRGSHQQSDLYWDTDDLALARRGWTCRWRNIPSRNRKLATLKSLPSLDRSQLAKRQEIEIHVGEFPEHPSESNGEFSRHLQSLPAKDVKRLTRLFNVLNQRHVIHLKRDDVVIEVALDAASVRNPASPEQAELGQFHELELELVEGNEQALSKTAHDLAAELDLARSRHNKFLRGILATQLADRKALRQLTKNRLTTGRVPDLSGHEDKPVTSELRRYLADRLQRSAVV